ncbi:protein of unknown function [Serratia sp. Tan611]|nr:protein of unknown function [Serratia sp. Tan611]
MIVLINKNIFYWEKINYDFKF